MIAWLLFTAASAYIGLIGWFFWADISDMYEQAQHEALLDELWDDDSDLAESA